ncbi:MAG: T9SS type A sorting domain-containing protein, partial [Bacteroidia bacterium]|nr:T9SS type A sorting domain-containing protein [Bacteroidia bacterium]
LNTFSGGTYDDLLIYDGSDENGVLLFDSDIDEPATLAGLEFTGSSGNLYVTFDSDFSVSCQSSGFLESWNFDVSCSSEQTAANPTGIGETINWGMSPNPSNGFVDLNLKDFVNSDVTIHVTDFTGKVLATYNVESLQNSKYRMRLNGQLSSGLYFIRLESNGHVSTKQLVLDR